MHAGTEERQHITQAAVSSEDNRLGGRKHKEEWLDILHLTRTTTSGSSETVAYPKIVLFFSKYHLRGLKLWSFRVITKIETNHFLELKAFIFAYWNLISSCQTKIIIQSKHVVTLPEGAAAGTLAIMDQYRSHALCNMTHIKRKTLIIELFSFSAVHAQTPYTEFTPFPNAPFHYSASS